jgi:two-component system KDP operon response regulator KdpE
VNATLLLVHDESVVRRAHALFLRAAGYHVVEADSGDGAVRAAAECTRPVDLVITDVFLPDQRGAELARKLMIAGTPRMLFTSEFSPRSEQVRAAGVPADAQVLERPFSPEDLLAAVLALLAPKPV